MLELRASWLGVTTTNPIQALFMIQTVTPDPGVGIDELGDFWPPLVRGGWFILGFIVVVVLGWYVVEPTLARIIHRRNRNNPTLQEAFTRYIRVIVLVIAVFVGAGTAGYGQFLNNSAIVVAAATLAVGVAGQAVVGSLVSGLALVVDPKFSVGDYIEWDDGMGTIQSITLRVTRVLTPDGELVTIPNTVLASNAITRPYGRSRYRIVDRVELPYDTDVNKALGHLTTAAKSVDSVLGNPAPASFVDELEDDAIVIRIHYWISEPSRRAIFEARSAFTQAVVTRFDAADITLSPPTHLDVQGQIDITEAN